jgi:hypothetical protein
VRPINKTQLKIELNRRGFSSMPISLIILKCFGSVHPSAVTNIKYFSTSGGGLDKQTPNKSVFIKPSQHNRFFDTDNKTEYCRTFGK